MGVIYVARSAKFSKWASDAGITKNVFKIGYSEEDPAPLIAAGWGGENDWTLVRFWNYQAKAWGTLYPAYGFIYPEKPGAGTTAWSQAHLLSFRCGPCRRP